MREMITTPLERKAKENLPSETTELEAEAQEQREEGKTYNIDFYITTHMVDDPEHWQPEKFREHLKLLKASGIDFIAYDWSWTRVNPGAGEFDEPVKERDGGEGFPGARGHLDQRARLVGGKAGFEVFHGLDLGGPEAVFDQYR